MRNTIYMRRHERRISQMALAKATGIPFYRMWKLENEYVEPRPSDREALAAYFGVAESVIFPDPPPDAAAPDDAAASA
jgi:transcriptional regulator with XRE-family HTH domain